ncbi:hypothetical protein [Legionella worsleiensis]|nr:hypothetical protein [Legionella worsleiensis]
MESEFLVRTGEKALSPELKERSNQGASGLFVSQVSFLLNSGIVTDQ